MEDLTSGDGLVHVWSKRFRNLILLYVLLVCSDGVAPENGGTAVGVGTPTELICPVDMSGPGGKKKGARPKGQTE